MLALAVLAAAGCSGGSDEPSFGDLVADLEGGEITPGELARRLEVADFLCQLDLPVLEAIWADLEPGQLEFQDVVFTAQCPERLADYGAATGRFRVERSG